MGNEILKLQRAAVPAPKHVVDEPREINGPATRR